jgi:FtsP/CotA-like multicopper oxidase with cupredoxin domain
MSLNGQGLEIPTYWDGLFASSQDPIPPGGRFVYEFTLHQEGTYFYHSHMAMQEMMGMIGAFIMHPKEAYKPRADKDFAIIMQEYAILPNIKVPNSMNMEFNWLTFNSRVECEALGEAPVRKYPDARLQPSPGCAIRQDVH